MWIVGLYLTKNSYPPGYRDIGFAAGLCDITQRPSVRLRNFRNRVFNRIIPILQYQLAYKNEICPVKSYGLSDALVRVRLKSHLFRKQPEADKLKSKFNEENEEKLPWHDVSRIIISYKYSKLISQNYKQNTR